VLQIGDALLPVPSFLLPVAWVAFFLLPVLSFLLTVASLLAGVLSFPRSYFLA